jgi:hypothetical protein
LVIATAASFCLHLDALNAMRGHLTTEWAKPRNPPARCAKCGETRTANYYPRKAGSQPAKFTSSAPTTNNTVTLGVSYASRLRKKHRDLPNIPLGSKALGYASTAKAEQSHPTIRQLLVVLRSNLPSIEIVKGLGSICNAF